MADFEINSALLGLIIGAISALTGTGGSILSIPLLMLGLDMQLTQAVPIALLATMSTASIGAIQGLRAGIVRYKTAQLMAVFGIAFAPLGIWLGKRVSTDILNWIFAVILMYVALRLWQQSSQTPTLNDCEATPACHTNPANSKLFWTASCTKRLIVTGSIAGLLSGLLGVGGGFVIVPSLRKVSNFDFQTILATSLMVIALVSTGSVLVYLLHGKIDWQICIPFVLSAVLSMLIIRVISHKIPSLVSQRLFAALALIAAALMFINMYSLNL